MKRVYKNRLLKLAEHLASGKLGHKKFDFGAYNFSPFGTELKPYSCGTSGCAIGECPIVFPRHWKFGENTFPSLKSFSDNEFGEATEKSGQIFFGITDDEYEDLFLPQDEKDEDFPYGGQDEISPWNIRPIKENATRRQVAASIRRFVAWKEEKGE